MKWIFPLVSAIKNQTSRVSKHILSPICLSSAWWISSPHCNCDTTCGVRRRPILLMIWIFNLQNKLAVTESPQLSTVLDVSCASQVFDWQVLSQMVLNAQQYTVMLSATRFAVRGLEGGISHKLTNIFEVLTPDSDVKFHHYKKERIDKAAAIFEKKGFEISTLDLTTNWHWLPKGLKSGISDVTRPFQTHTVCTAAQWDTKPMDIHTNTAKSRTAQWHTSPYLSSYTQVLLAVRCCSLFRGTFTFSTLEVKPWKFQHCSSQVCLPLVISVR